MSRDPGVDSCWRVGQAMRKIGNGLGEIDFLSPEEAELALVTMLRHLRKRKRLPPRDPPAEKRACTE